MAPACPHCGAPRAAKTTPGAGEKQCPFSGHIMAEIATVCPGCGATWGYNKGSFGGLVTGIVLCTGCLIAWPFAEVMPAKFGIGVIGFLGAVELIDGGFHRLREKRWWRHTSAE